MDFIFGIHPILELLRAKRRAISTIYTTKPEPQAFKQIRPLLSQKIKIQYVTRDALSRMVESTEHQGIVAAVAPFPFQKDFFNSEKYPFLVMLDGVQDPRNLGAIIRSAYCTNMSGLVLIKKGSAPLTPTAIKASAGLAEHMPIFVAPSAGAAVQLLKKAKYHLYGAALGGKPLDTVTLAQPLCLVIGSEGSGISREVLDAGTAIMLAQKAPDISYNASVAAGILLYSVAQKHKLLT